MRSGLDGLRSRGVAACLLLAVTGLAACGDDGTAGESTSAGRSTAVSEPAAPTGGYGAGGATEAATADGAELCEDLAAVRDSVETMRGVTVGEGALPVLAEELGTLEPALRELRADAAEQYRTQVDDVEAGLTDLQSGVDAAQADPTRETLREVTTAVRELGTAVDALVDEVGTTC